jgi:hypothetical protein
LEEALEKYVEEHHHGLDQLGYRESHARNAARVFELHPILRDSSRIPSYHVYDRVRVNREIAQTN